MCLDAEFLPIQKAGGGYVRTVSERLSDPRFLGFATINRLVCHSEFYYPQVVVLKVAS